MLIQQKKLPPPVLLFSNFAGWVMPFFYPVHIVFTSMLFGISLLTYLYLKNLITMLMLYKFSEYKKDKACSVQEPGV